jgi:hypothetical protein
MNKSKEKIKENPIVANRAIYMANPCHLYGKPVPYNRQSCANIVAQLIY